MGQESRTFRESLSSAAEKMCMREGQGFRAEAKAGDMHLILMATHTALGPIAFVFDVKTNREVTAHESATDFDDAKDKAESLAKSWNRVHHPKTPFPALEWKPTG